MLKIFVTKRTFPAFSFHFLRGFGLGIDRASVKIFTFHNITGIIKYQYPFRVGLARNATNYFCYEALS